MLNRKPITMNPSNNGTLPRFALLEKIGQIDR